MMKQLDLQTEKRLPWIARSNWNVVLLIVGCIAVAIIGAIIAANIISGAIQ